MADDLSALPYAMRLARRARAVVIQNVTIAVGVMVVLVVWALLLGLIRLYQLTLSPWLGRQCRFDPTCSVYASEALQRFGAWWRKSTMPLSRSRWWRRPRLSGARGAN